MKWLVWLLFAFNCIDFAATAYVLTRALAVEYNPVAAYLYGFHPAAWLIVKFLLWMVGAMALLSNPTDKSHRTLFLVVTVFYGCLALYQIAVLTIGAVLNAH
jgi:hypothetical protein